LHYLYGKKEMANSTYQETTPDASFSCAVIPQSVRVEDRQRFDSDPDRIPIFDADPDTDPTIKPG
jgi:hypothetical protein